MPEITTCPPPEDLAALVDGTLGAEERARLMEHLAECEICFEVFSETVRTREEIGIEMMTGTLGAPASSPDTPGRRRPDDPLPFRKRLKVPLRFVVPFLVAATVVLSAGIGLYKMFWGMPSLEAYRLADLFEGEAPELTGTFVQNTYRSLPPEIEDLDQIAFLAGVRLVDLQVALVAENKDRARDMALQLRGFLENGLFFDVQSQEFRRIAEELDEGTRTPMDLRRELVPMEGTLTELLEEGDEVRYFSVGKWMEAARLAATTGRTDYFARGETRRFLRHLRKLPADTFPEPVEEDLNQVDKVLSAEELHSDQLAVLEESLAHVISFYLNYCPPVGY